MKTNRIYRLLYGGAVLLLVGFVLCVGVDLWRYDAGENSAPFSVQVLVRGLEFVLPGLLLGIVGRILHKRERAGSHPAPKDQEKP